MKYRQLGRTGLKVSLLGLGTGGPSSLGQSSDLARQDQIRLIRRCFDLGINFLDTSAGYGQSEEILSWGLEGVPRDSYILATKWGHASDWSPRDVGGADGPVSQDPEAFAAGVEESLRRLRTDHIDIMQFHGLRSDQYHEVVDRFRPVAERMKQQGKIRFMGFSERFIADPKHEVIVLGLQTDPDFWDTVMLKYGILNQYAAREALPLAQEHGTGVLNMAAVRIKLPSPEKLAAQMADWKERGLIAKDALPEQNPLGWLVRGPVESVVSAGYKFAADHPAISTVLSGTANLSHLEANVAAIEGASLPEENNQRLRELFGEIAEYA